jgi:SagB-type dehydrogenase family enzyme
MIAAVLKHLAVSLAGPRRGATPAVPRWILAALDGTHDELALADQVVATRGHAGLRVFYQSLASLRAAQRVGYTVRIDRHAVATWIPRGADRLAPVRVTARTRVSLSRFAYLRRDHRDTVLESPIVRGRLILRDPRAAALVGALDRPRSVSQLSTVTSLPRIVTRQLVTLMLTTGFLESATERKSPLSAWEFHDLLFHARSRHGRHGPAYGARSRRRRTPLRPVKAPRAADIVKLPRPDLDALRRHDMSLTSAIEDRASNRVHDDARPISKAELAEFLYRTARTRESKLRAGKRLIATRLAPTGGAAGELEIYVAVRRCRGIRAGLYRYDSRGHALWRRAPLNGDVRGLIAAAGFAARTTPQLLIIVSARFARTLDRYASMAYAMILKDVGVLFQTFYLVATAMGLAPCAIGGGDADDFCRAAGTDYFEETSVGEFLIGRMRRSKATPVGLPRPVHGSHP